MLVLPIKGPGTSFSIIPLVGCGVLVKFDDAPNEFNGVPVKHLLSFDVNFYENEEEWKKSKSASDVKEEKVRF